MRLPELRECPTKDYVRLVNEGVASNAPAMGFVKPLRVALTRVSFVGGDVSQGGSN